MKEKMTKEQILEEAARRNEIVVLDGHAGCDEAVGHYAVGDGKLARFTVGQVRAKRIELGLEEDDNVQEN